MASTPSKTQKIHMQCPVAQLIPIHGTKPSQRLVTSPSFLGWTTSSILKWGSGGTSTLHYLRHRWCQMLEVLDLSGNLPSFQAGFASLPLLHKVVSLSVTSLGGQDQGGAWQASPHWRRNLNASSLYRVWFRTTVCGCLLDLASFCDSSRICGRFWSLSPLDVN